MDHRLNHCFNVIIDQRIEIEIFEWAASASRRGWPQVGTCQDLLLEIFNRPYLRYPSKFPCEV